MSQNMFFPWISPEGALCRLVLLGSDPREQEWRIEERKMGKERRAIQRGIMKLFSTLGKD